jgi:hypothetical protein
VIRGWINELRTVGNTSIDEQRYEGRFLRVASVLRWPFELGVTISLVRTKSNGERASPVATAAVAATKSDAQGYGEAISIMRSMSSLTPMSGTLKIALRKLLPQFSSSDCNTV